MNKLHVTSKMIAEKKFERAATEIVKRFRKREMWDRMMTNPIWSDRVNILDVWRGLPDEALEKLQSILTESLRNLMWEIGVTSPNEAVRRRIASYQTCPPQALQILASDKSSDVLLELLRNSALPDASRPLLFKAITSLKWEYLISVAKSEACSHVLMEKLAGRKDWQIRASVARNEAASKTVLEVLAKDKQMEVRDAVANNPSTPTSILEQLARDSEMGVRRSVARNCAAGIVLEELAKDPSQHVRYVVGKNPATSSAMLEVLSADMDVREAVIQNPSTPVLILAKLAADDSLSYGVAWNASVPLELRQRALDTLTMDQGGSSMEQKYMREKVAKCAATSEPVLFRLAVDTESSVRQGVAENTSAPSKILEQLAGDSDRWVRLNVAKNPTTPIQVRKTLLNELITDDYWNVRCDLAEDPHTPPELLAALATDSSQEVRFAVASNTATPSESLRVLAADPDKMVFRAALLNPLAPESLRERFISEWTNSMLCALKREVCIRSDKTAPTQLEPTTDDIFRALIWLNCVPESADIKTLTKASQSKDWLTRLAVAIHPQTTPALLNLLSADADKDVASVAVSRS